MLHIPDGFSKELKDQSVIEDEMCLHCRKNPLTGTLPLSAVLRILGICLFMGIFAFGMGMYYAETYGLCAVR